MKIKDVMTADVVTVAPGESLKEVARLLVERRISGVPVVDVEGRVLGVVSEADVLVKERGAPRRERAGRKLEARVAGEAMTAPAVTIPPSFPLAAAADLMIHEGVNRLPVVAAGKLVGIVTRADLVRAFARSDSEIVREIREEVVANRMLLDPFTVDVEVSAGETLLTGELGRRSQAELLPALTSRVAGVVGVRSRLTWREDDTTEVNDHIESGR